MFKFKLKRLGIIAGLSLLLVAVGCGQDDTNEVAKDVDESADEATTNESEEMDYTITGIEPGAGQTGTNETALTEYENLAGWEQETSSSGAMLTSLGNAIDNEEPIIVSAWAPHYKFAKWDLKFLDDPQGVFGEEEYVTTIVRSGLKDDNPEAYTIFDRFHWELEEMESALLQAQEMDFDFEKVAKHWVEENQENVEEWTEGVEQVDGTTIELATSSWDTELFAANIAKVVLEQQGFIVELTVVDPTVLFEAISAGDVDASLSPWLPTSHGAFYDEYEGQFEDLGANLSGVRIGLAVPTYMDIDSIEDLEPKE